MSEADSKRATSAAAAKALVDYLEEEISTGRLGDGMKLPAERELSDRFGTSRSTVRRVLQTFKTRGLIGQVVGSGTFVLPGAAPSAPAGSTYSQAIQISPAELMEARLLIEPLMPRLIVRNATPSDFARMNECLEYADAATTTEAFEYWDGELHRALASATHNAFFVQVLELSDRVRERGEWGRLKQRTLSPERRAEYQAQHRALVAALRDRDASAASEKLTNHLRQVQADLFET